MRATPDSAGTATESTERLASGMGWRCAEKRAGWKGRLRCGAPQFDRAHARQVYACPTTRARALVPIEASGRMRWMTYARRHHGQRHHGPAVLPLPLLYLHRAGETAFGVVLAGLGGLLADFVIGEYFERAHHGGVIPCL